MLKKSKRTLSLVLALVMLCSTMGVMAFAAEEGDVYWFEGYSSSFTLYPPTDGSETLNTSYCRVYFSGTWHNLDGSFAWDSLYCSITSTVTGNLTWSINSNYTSKDRIISIYEDGNDLIYRIYVSCDTYNETVTVRYVPVRNGEDVLPRLSVGVTCDVELM